MVLVNSAILKCNVSTSFLVKVQFTCLSNLFWHINIDFKSIHNLCTFKTLLLKWLERTRNSECRTCDLTRDLPVLTWDLTRDLPVLTWDLTRDLRAKTWDLLVTCKTMTWSHLWLIVRRIYEVWFHFDLQQLVCDYCFMLHQVLGYNREHWCVLVDH